MQCDGTRGTQVTEGPDGVAGRRIRLPGPASPSAKELNPKELAVGAPGLLLGGRLDLTEITGLTLAAIVPAFAEGAGVFVLEHLLKGGEPVTTNNRMELMAAISALEALKSPCVVELHTDSEYLRKTPGLAY